uniref:filamentous growth regulator 23-like isoform X4 n=1 Tax=Ciona intestinalis TaxID=7719 RepID=UPI000EF55356|nr:filamentous growth regulator 23-like isoform X4 [Ciona intestinalis]|eukprot:XP_026691324.1 filamentous growth regulator 23-like isoform X4 [Ciona intestinalis]
MIKLYFLLCLIGTLNYSKGQICTVTDGSGSVYEYAPANSTAWDGGVEGTNGIDYTLQLDSELTKYFNISADTLIVKSGVNITRDDGTQISGKLNCFLTAFPGPPIPTTLRIDVRKININPPMFQGEPYATSLGDGTSVGSQVIVVSATDEEVNTVAYSIVDQTPADVFALTGSSGIITIKNPIQSFEMHNITISATTSGFDNVGGTLIQNTETVVRITITDDDNHAPQFQPTVEVGNILVPPLYTATVVYGETNVNFTSSSIEAKDLDVKLNSAIRYGFVNGDPSTYTEYFQIDPTTGVVSMKKALEATSGITKFSISVSATEDTGKSSLTYLTIDAVMSVDQHKPMVTVSSSASIGYIQASNANSIAYVTEDEEGNTPFQFTTTDADNNGTFIYEVTSPYDVTKAGYLIYDPLGTTTTFSDIIEIVAVNIDVDVASPNRRSDPVSITVNSVTTPEPTTMETTQPETTEATTQQVTTPLSTTEQVTTEATTVVVTTQLSTTEQVTTEATTVTTPVSTTEQVTTEATTVTTPVSTTEQQTTPVTTPASTTQQVTTQATTVTTPSSTTEQVTTPATTATTAQVTTQQSTTDSTVVTSTATTPEITTIQTTVVTTQPPDTTQATTVGQSTITNGNTHPSSTAPGSTTGVQSTSPTVVTPTVTPVTSAGISTNTVITAPNTTSSQTISIQTSPANPTNNGVNTTAAATNNPHTTVSTSNIPSQPCPVDMTTKGNGVPVGDQVSAVTLYAVAGSLGAALAICLIIIAYLLYKYCREPKDVDDDKSDDGNKPESENMSSEQIITVTGYSNGAYDKHNESNDGVYTEVNEVEGKENDSGTEINEYDQDRSSPEPEPEEEDEEEEASLPEPFVPPEEEDRNSELELPAGGLVAAGIAGAAVATAIADEVDDKDVLPLPVNEDDAQDYGKAYVNDDVRHERILKTGSFGSLQLVTIQKYGSERRDKLSVVHKYKLAKISYTEKSSVESRIVLLERICEQEHNNILQYYGKHEDADEIHFAMMYAEKGNLRDHLRSHGHELSSSQILFLISGAGKGLQYLHSRNIVHCHLQAKCIMLDNQLTPLVTDVENNEIASVKVGDRERWQALEVLNNELSSKSTDIWSFGVLMWEVLSLGAVPYEDLSIATGQIKEYLESGQRLRQPAGCSDAVFKVMEGCWNERSRMRPDVYVLNGSLDEMLTQDHDEHFTNQKVRLGKVSSRVMPLSIGHKLPPIAGARLPPIKPKFNKYVPDERSSSAWE